MENLLFQFLTIFCSSVLHSFSEMTYSTSDIISASSFSIVEIMSKASRQPHLWLLGFLSVFSNPYQSSSLLIQTFLLSSVLKSFFVKNFHLFVYFGCPVFVAALGLSQLPQAGAPLRCRAGLLMAGASLVEQNRLEACELQQLQLTGAAVAAHRFSICSSRVLECPASAAEACGLSSCGALAQVRHDMCNLPRPGIEPVSPALAGRFFPTVLPTRKVPKIILDGEWGSSVTTKAPLSFITYEYYTVYFKFQFSVAGRQNMVNN